MKKINKRIPACLVLLLILFSVLAGCFAAGHDEAARQGPPTQAGLPVITVFKAPT